MKLSIKSLIASLILVVSVVSLIGCNTVKGVGKDVQKGGQEIQKAAS